MEQIKITDKLTLRQEALRMAVDFISATKTGAGWQGIADSFESYLQGESVLPEYVDTSKMFADVMEKMNERWNQPNPWIPADSEMKPAKGVEVLCALRYAVNNIIYQVMYYDHENEEWYGGADDDNTNHVVAWCPIVPFTQPTL